MPSVLVIGLGAMGGAIAVRLHEHSDATVYGYDVNSAAIERFVARGGQAAYDLSRLDNVDVIITSLPNDEILLSVVRSQLLEKLNPEQTFVEMSTVLPQTMVTLATELKGRVKEIVDSPVSGGPNECKNGKLSLLVGVEGGTLQTSTTELLAHLGSINLLGDAGRGKAMKLVNNAISMSNVAIFTEAFQLGAELGLDDHTMYNVLCHSGGSSTMLKKRIPYVLEDDFTARFSVNLAEKDTGLALQMAHQCKYPAPLLAGVHQRYELARRNGLGEEDVVALIKLNRQ